MLEYTFLDAFLFCCDRNCWIVILGSPLEIICKSKGNKELSHIETESKKEPKDISILDKYSCNQCDYQTKYKSDCSKTHSFKYICEQCYYQATTNSHFYMSVCLSDDEDLHIFE